MSKAITWTFLYNSSFLEDVDLMLRFLRERTSEIGSVIKGELPKMRREKRDDILKFIEDIHLIEVTRAGSTSRYSITEEGIRYLKAKNRCKHLHKLLCKHILHYSYFYDYILENELYAFSKLQIIEALVLNSTYEFGVRIFDWKSSENVVNLMLEIGVLSYENSKYLVNREYQTDFNNSIFEELIINKLESDSPMFTKDLCSYLVSQQDDFINSDKEVTIRMIYKHLLRVAESKNILKFIPGLPRPPIPSKHTLVELKRG